MMDRVISIIWIPIWIQTTPTAPVARPNSSAMPTVTSDIIHHRLHLGGDSPWENHQLTALIFPSVQSIAEYIHSSWSMGGGIRGYRNEMCDTGTVSMTVW